MSFYDFKSYYLTDTKGGRFVRYDVIAVDDDNYLVKVFDEHQGGVSTSHQIVMVDELKYDRGSYKDRYGIGRNQSIKYDTPPTFEGHVRIEMQAHREGIA